MTKIYTAELVGKKESVVDEFLLMNEHQTPLLNLLGFGEAVYNVKHEWVEDEMFADESTVSGAKLAEDTAITVADAEPFRVGHVVKVGEELMLVTSVVGNDLTVSRGYASTTAADIADGAVIEVMFLEGHEGADARDARYKPRSRKENLTQIFDESVEISGTAQAIAQYGVDSEYDKERMKKQIELALHLEKALINGLGFESGNVRQMRGVRSFINTNVVDGSGASITDAKINDAFQAIYEKGGFDTGANYKILVPAKQKRVISDFQKSDIRLTRQDNGRGQVVDHFVSDFGEAEIVLNNNLKSDELMIVDVNRMQIRPLNTREFAHTYMGIQGDYMKGQIVGEYTLEFKQEKAHARITNLD